MLQLANTDGRVEDATPVAKSLLFTRGSGRQVETYVQALLKNTNRMIMYSFLPQESNSSVNEESPSASEAQKIEEAGPSSDISVEGVSNSLERASRDVGVGCRAPLEKATVLQLLLANRKLIFCGSNSDLDLICALCVNLFPMAWDNEQSMRSLVIEVWKALLTLRGPALEDVMVTRGIQVYLPST